jgi:predicted phage terminase large subunit-like protein
MGALQYVCVPGYASLLLRQTWPQLTMDEGLIPRAEEWLAPTAAEWIASERRWEFPSGASIMFGHLDREADRFKFAGGAWQYIGWDELTNWPTSLPYTFMFSRLRRKKDDLEEPIFPRCPKCGLSVADVPLRVRWGTNPGSAGGQWVFDRTVGPWLAWRKGEGPRPEKPFMPARISDNPSLDVDEYLESLLELDPITRAQIRDGDWEIRPQGKMLKAEWFPIVDDWPREARLVRFWDLAATEEGENPDPDWTVGGLLALHEGVWFLVDVVRGRWSPHATDKVLVATAEADKAIYGRKVAIRMEQEPGSSGKRVIADVRRRLFSGYDFDGCSPQDSKVDRARPLASAAEAGNFKLLRGEWNQAWLAEAVMFPPQGQGQHDDQVDVVSGGMDVLAGKRRARLRG